MLLVVVGRHLELLLEQAVAALAVIKHFQLLRGNQFLLLSERAVLLEM
jgi:hypothetical protein